MALFGAEPIGDGRHRRAAVERRDGRALCGEVTTEFPADAAGGPRDRDDLTVKAQTSASARADRWNHCPGLRLVAEVYASPRTAAPTSTTDRVTS